VSGCSVPDRLYVAVRNDLEPGLQAAQGIHAYAQFAHDFPDITREWLVRSNYLVVVSVPDEAALLDLVTAASAAGLRRAAIREPDLDNQATAVAIEPGPLARRLCARLPRALRDATVGTPM
jgi:peptidyl-tRNA hydrolase